ncbi:urea transporter [Malassezia pachydermatis]|uniref:Urea transporter n=1 Tax=Malassezia pachydermatis TaxID=77020 RepID=A0A0M8MMH6_9BASI|nr:urea transporter [Malassezia pachydermatis]KOS15476.1 urea transporter [Malassezia pachydermatis]
MSSNPAQVLGEGVGWAVVCGLGFAFAAFMMAITFLQNRFTEHSTKSVEEFNSASRSVKPGLIAAGIVSAWTWAATLLQSSAVTYEYGVSGAYWYAAGATLQILLCSIMACKIKSCAPFCSTFLEVIRIRHGKAVHAVFMVFALVTNLLVSSQLVLGGAAVVNELTGLHILAGIFLIPTSVAAYTVTGGLRATFIADYSHTVGLFIIILYFFFNIWTGHGKIGSLSHMVEMLERAALTKPVEGNAHGSYLTMRSQGGLIFGIINICGNLATVFCDQSYHQRSIASLPTTASRGFLLGGSAWFPIPFLFGTTMGLAARALQENGLMQTLAPEQISAGLPAPTAAAALTGKGGAVAILILLFLAVTSATSAQQIAVSSVLTFDVWKVYIHPNPKGQHIQWITHGAVILWAIVMAIFGLIWNYASIGLGWLYTMMGIAVAPAVFPIFGSLTWHKTNSMACVVGMVVGCILGIMTWLVTAGTLYGAVTVETTGMQYPTIAGNLVSLLSSTIITVTWSWLRPQNYTFADTRAFNAPDDALYVGDHVQGIADEKLADFPVNETEDNGSDKPVVGTSDFADMEPGKAEVTTGHLHTHMMDAGEDNINYVRAAGLDPAVINSTVNRVMLIAIVCSLLLVIIVPAIATCARTWNYKGLGAWIYLGFIWLFWSILAVGVLPLWEDRTELTTVLANIFRRRRAAKMT